MTPRELIEHARIIEVWHALGGPDLRHKRGPAFWRGSDDLNVSVHSDRNIFFDHVTGAGGGILDLVQLVLACDRKAALAWLADLYHVDLDSGMTPVESSSGKPRRSAIRQPH